MDLKMDTNTEIMKVIEDLLGRDLFVCVFTADESMRCVGDADGISEFLGYNCTRFRDGESVWGLVDPGELERRHLMLAAQLKDDDIEIVLPLVHADGGNYWFLYRGHVCDGRINGVFVSVKRIKSYYDHQVGKLSRYKERLVEAENIVSTLQVLSEQDSLTKLYNADTTRHLCEEYLSDAHAQCALIMFDLDGFKQVNDMLGHMEGDRVITGAASEIKRLFRSGDVVGRVGGDEFLVLMKDIPNADIVRKKCDMLVHAVESMGEELGCPFLGCSAGAVVTYAGGADYDQLFRAADAAMYSVKNNGGRHCRVVSCFADSINYDK